MMSFRTDIKLAASAFKISYHDRLMLMGSCFSDNMGEQLNSIKMKVTSNPFGVSFNPFSIGQSLVSIVQKKQLIEVDKNSDYYFSFDYHSSFSSTSKELVLDRINAALFNAHDDLKRSNVLFITFGSAWVYRHIAQNRIVANCNKVPNKEFVKELLTIENIVQNFNVVLAQLKDFNPNLKVVFTVSPVRHLKDGFIENQRSKAILLESVHRLVEVNPHCSYFPSYEIVMDDLRDYRFFKKDMLHLNDIGVDYVWEKFCDYYFDDQTKVIMNEVLALNAFLQHRSILDTDHESKKENELVKMKEKYPFLKW